MSATSPGPRTAGAARFGQALLVAGGWYATVVAAFAIGVLSVPHRPPEPDGCTAIFSCLAPAEELRLVLGVATAVVVHLLVVTVPVAALVTRVVRSAILAGTASAAASVLVAALVAASWGTQ